MWGRCWSARPSTLVSSPIFLPLLHAMLFCDSLTLQILLWMAFALFLPQTNSYSYFTAPARFTLLSYLSHIFPVPYRQKLSPTLYCNVYWFPFFISTMKLSFFRQGWYWLVISEPPPPAQTLARSIHSLNLYTRKLPVKEIFWVS